MADDMAKITSGSLIAAERSKGPVFTIFRGRNSALWMTS
jgi:hypothetical protein